MLFVANVLADFHDRMMDGGGAGWWVWGVLMMVLMLGIVALVVWLIVRSSHGSAPAGQSSSGREILSERFARGEIDADEYHDRLSKLR
jgi:putative membrane protein